MTPRERVLAAMAGGMPDRVPFAIWNNKLPGEPVNSRLMEAQACIINKSTVYTVSHCNLPLREARAFWPDKTIQINFPSSVHLNGPQKVREAAMELLGEAAPGDGFIVGISEDISDGGVETLVPLAQTVYEYGQTPFAGN